MNVAWKVPHGIRSTRRTILTNQQNRMVRMGPLKLVQSVLICEIILRKLVKHFFRAFVHHRVLHWPSHGDIFWWICPSDVWQLCRQPSPPAHCNMRMCWCLLLLRHHKVGLINVTIDVGLRRLRQASLVRIYYSGMKTNLRKIYGSLRKSASTRQLL